MKKVSVIIPAHNRAHLVNRAIESVLAQSQPPDRIVLVNDLSTDQTAAVLDSWQAKDPRILAVHRQCNGGPAAARNDGVAASDTEFVTFLDSDDRWHPRHLEECLAFLQDGAGVDLVFSDVSRVSIDGEIIQPAYLRQTKQIKRFMKRYAKGPGGDDERGGWWLFETPEREVLLKQFCVPVQTSVMRRSLAQDFPFDPDIRGLEDYDFALRLALAGNRFGFVDRADCDCFLHDGNLVAHPKAELRNCSEEQKMWKKLLRREGHKWDGVFTVQSRLSDLCIEEGYLHREALHPAKAAKAYLRSLCYRWTWSALKGMMLAPLPPRKFADDPQLPLTGASCE